MEKHIVPWTCKICGIKLAEPTDIMAVKLSTALCSKCRHYVCKRHLVSKRPPICIACAQGKGAV